MPPRRKGRIIGRVVAAILAAGFVYAIVIYLTLPDVRVLATANPERTAFQELRAREARRAARPVRRVHKWIAYSRISPSLTRAVLVAEDAKFWQHDGVDIAQLKESIEVNIERREFSRGGSTITQQLAKNLYLSPSKNPVRKLRELLIARRLEAELSKQRILELYLNVIEWGDGIYGAEAAARTYFGTSAAALDADRAALLAAAIVNPRLLNPGRPSARLRRRQQMIAKRMGAVTPPAVAGAEAAGPGPRSAPAVPTLPVSGLPAELPGQGVPESAGRCAPPCR